MQSFVILAVVAIAIVGVGALFLLKSTSKKPEPAPAPEEAEAAPVGEEKTEEAPEPAKKEKKKKKKDETEIPDTGPVTQVGKGWVLNPKSTFPLMLYNIDGNVAKQMKEILEDCYSKSFNEMIRRLKPLIIEHDIRCKQIDDYINVYGPIFKSKCNSMKNDSSTWTASAGGVEAMLAAMKDKAAGALDVQPDCNLAALIDNHPSDVTAVDLIAKKYGAEIGKYYRGKKKGLYVVPAEHPERKRLEELVKVQLAVHGSRVSPNLVLATLSLDDMNKIVSDLTYPEFKDKSVGVETLAKLPDLRHRLNNVVNFKDFFEIIVPKDMVEEDTDEDKKKATYSHEVAKLLATTYFRGGNAVSDQVTYSSRTFSFIKSWEISVSDEACPYCKKFDGKKFERKQYPRVPLHLGCNCKVISGT